MQTDSVIPPSGRLGLFFVGGGAVASTLIAGIEAVRRHGKTPVGSYAQLGHWPTEMGGGALRDRLALAALDDVVCGGVDLVEENALEAARRAGVLSQQDLAAVEPWLASVKFEAGWYEPDCVRELTATRAQPPMPRAEQVAGMQAAFARFQKESGADRVVVLLTTSTEVAREPGAAHATMERFAAALAADDASLLPSQLYAWAALDAGYPVVNCTPNPVLEAPALRELAVARGVPLAGSDLKSGQTFMKTIVAAALGQRLLGVEGWYSTNILGNRDGLVLHDPENFRAKEITKSGVLAGLLDAEAQPELYRDLVHQVHIHYHPPKGDNKEAWDAIQLFGWLGYGMEMKINFECRDSILAAPLVLDLALFTDLATRQGASGVQSWLSHYFKHPSFNPGEERTHDFNRQLVMFYRQLSSWAV